MMQEKAKVQNPDEEPLSLFECWHSKLVLMHSCFCCLTIGVFGFLWIGLSARSFGCSSVEVGIGNACTCSMPTSSPNNRQREITCCCRSAKSAASSAKTSLFDRFAPIFTSQMINTGDIDNIHLRLVPFTQRSMSSLQKKNCM